MNPIPDVIRAIADRSPEEVAALLPANLPIGKMQVFVPVKGLAVPPPRAPDAPGSQFGWTVEVEVKKGDTRRDVAARMLSDALMYLDDSGEFDPARAGSRPGGSNLFGLQSN